MSFRLACCLLLCLILPAAVRGQDRVPVDHWMRYASPEDAGFSSDSLAAAAQFADSIGTAAYLLVYDDAVVASRGDVTRRYMAHSVRKSLLSALYGTYVATGAVDLDATMADLGIDDRDGLTPEEKQATVRQLLEARSGIYHPSAYFGASALANLPERGSHAPGTYWHYNNWDFNTLGTILRQETGDDLFEAFDERIAEPIGMQDYRPRDGYYHYERDLSEHAAYPFRMSARDLARFGLLFEHGGSWNGRRVVPETWVDASTRAYSDTRGKELGTAGYGYLWWTLGPPFDAYGGYAALGVGTQVVAVLPALDIVFVHRVDTYRGDYVTDYWKLLERLLAARTGEAAPEPQLVPLQPPATRPQPASVPDDVLRRYVGTYTYADGKTVTVHLRHGTLLRYDPEWGTFALTPQSPTAFAVEDVRRPAYFDARDDGTWTYVEEGRLLEEGDFLLDERRPADALDVFARGASFYPTSARMQMGLGRTYLALSDTTRAVRSFRHAFDLDPNNLSAEGMLAQLGPTVPVEARLRSAYAGTYTLDTFTMRVEQDGSGLVATPPWGGRVPLVPQSETAFFLEDTPVKVTFVREDGEVTGLRAALGVGDNVRVLDKVE